MWDTTSLRQFVFHRDTLPSDLPVISDGVSPVSDMPNLRRAEHIDTDYVGTFGPYSKRCILLTPTIPIVPDGHLVIADGGHETTLTDGGTDDYGMQHVVRTLLAWGFATLIAPMEDAGSAVHIEWGASYSPTVNPMERFFAPVAIAMNGIASRFRQRSMTGLSGGGWMTPFYAAMDDRINHAIVSVRGTAPVSNPFADWEQTQLPEGMSFADHYTGIYRLAASIARRLCIVHNDLDGAGFGPPENYNDAVMDAIHAEFPFSDPQFLSDPDLTPEHFYTQWTIDNALWPALIGSLLAPSAPVDHPWYRHSSTIN